MSQEFTLHQNGKGKIHGYEAHVSADSFLNGLSEVSGQSTVHRSSIIDSRCVTSRVFSSTLKLSVARCSTLSHVDAFYSDFIDTNSAECVVDGSRLKSCDVLSLNGERPYLTCVDLEGVIVEGSAVIRDFNLKGVARIHAGVWYRAPRHVEIVGNDIHVGITECTEGRAHLACSCKKLSWWLKRREHLKTRLLKRGWLTEQAEKVLLTFEEWSDVKLEAA